MLHLSLHVLLLINYRYFPKQENTLSKCARNKRAKRFAATEALNSKLRTFVPKSRILSRLTRRGGYFWSPVDDKQYSARQFFYRAPPNDGRVKRQKSGRSRINTHNRQTIPRGLIMPP